MKLASLTKLAPAAIMLVVTGGSVPAPFPSTGGAPPLPITVVVPGRAGTHLVLLISGEAGKTEFETTLARELSAAGSGVLILDAKSYLSSRKSPSRAATETEEAIRRYAKVWNRPRIVVVGYSRGADVAPFIANRLSADLKQQLAEVVLLAPAGRASFELTLRDAMTKRPRATDLPVMPELERLRGTRLLCAYGREESAPFCSRLDSTLVRVVVRAGGHKLAQVDGRPIAQLIAERLGP